MPRRSRAAAEATRSAVASRAADLGSIEGLEALSIGRLAGDLGLSKAGVVGPFGSKQALQLAAIESALERFREAIWEPSARIEPGIERLRAIVEAWFDYLEHDAFPGGCFLTAASLEFDDRPGPVRDAIARAWSRWLEALEGELETARAAGDLDADLDPAQAAFRLHGYVMAANWSNRLGVGDEPLEQGREAARALLR